MGCTSSAPNMPLQAHVTDQHEKNSEELKDQTLKDAEEVIYTDDGNGKHENKVLPLCDTLGEPILLDRNNKSLIESPVVDVDKVSDSYPNGHITDGDNTVTKNEELQNEDKLSSLEEVVEKVVVLYVADNPVENAQVQDNEKTNESTNEVDMKTADDTSDEVPESENDSKQQKEEKLEEAISPSQSTSSRATRWEALADIAAELPPSLAVDPVTGQIYALSK